ncbi:MULTISPECIES: acetoacetate--CoA ligase [unclassified Microbacterium]|uniref:acetoacetate--CoA ligase n=1 Tax=unclassified Microbacterium TaxID=2609290 RepID=UPI00214AE65A|nr:MULTISPECIES: acetoacetate--CoA ligase [unclassified Microbacterium]MCR2808401.1 acetoacetate--CoA ligase [Microbacterium sp. zg.B185]WIM19153.1 acetoacetate--CoA ligase [Microbacterium sp. zg-B185]
MTETAPSPILYELPEEVRQTTVLQEFIDWVADRRGIRLDGYADLYKWSVTDLDGFWESVWQYYDVHSVTPYTAVLAEERMPGAVWFPGARLNYAEHVLRGDGSRCAFVAYSQTRETQEWTVDRLRDEVGRIRTGLIAAGVGKGDRVAAYLPNIPETIAAELATVSLGAVWATCAPEFGTSSAIDRLGIIEPTVLFAVAGYRYGRKDIDRTAEVSEIKAAIPSIEHLVEVAYPEHRLEGAAKYEDFGSGSAADLAYEYVPFDHPLFVIFTSGTTGRPKAITHSHGGVLLEHLKNHGLSWGLREGDRLFWYSTTAWMVWNSLASTLVLGASVVLIDGDPTFPDSRELWRLAEATNPDVIGMSPAYLRGSRAEGVEPRKEFHLPRLKQYCAVGSPFPLDGYQWVLDQFGPTVLLNVGSGGTDVCSGIVQGAPLVPVYEGEISSSALGVATAAFDEHGQPLLDRPGELVITRPMPSMPVGFWGDTDGSLMHDAYFDTYPGVWRHGDWAIFHETGACHITGRSDATLNRGGVRLGTSEFYRVIDGIERIVDSLMVFIEGTGDKTETGELLLFVTLADGVTLTEELKATIARTLRAELSPRHVPDAIHAVPMIPLNRTGKKLEIPVKRLLQGRALGDVAQAGALAEPASLDWFAKFAVGRRG